MLEERMPADRPSVHASFDRACRLASDVLLVAAGSLESPKETVPSVTLVRDGRAFTAACRRLDYVSSGESHPVCSLLMIALPETAGSSEPQDSFVLRDGDRELELSGSAISRIEADSKTFVRENLAPLDADERARVLSFLVKALPSQPSRRAISLAETLFTLRQALRERLPRYRHAPDQPRGLSLDSIMSIDDSSFYLSGWLRDEEAEVIRFTAVSPEGSRVELGLRSFRYRRPEITAYFSGGARSGGYPDEEAGFICFVELESPSLLSGGWIVEMENAHGAKLEAPCPPVLRVAVATRNQILADAVQHRLPDELMVDHVMPALLRIAKQVETSTKIESVTTFGEPAAEPRVSIIVPLYKRIDLVEQQLAEFTRDPEVKQADLVYVLDSPEQEDALLDLVRGLFPIYEVPLRVAVLQRNVGFANATNAGASIAHGQLLLLMNSDVMPDKPGWLSRLASFYEATPKIGALGPKLLYEDGSIQHAGMHFHQPVGSTLWQDAHYFRGLHRDFPAANVARQVPLVSGACMMISRSLWEDLGGLQGCYVQGDYEDSDLCMRLAERGFENWYTPDVELYHLEALSYMADLRVPANLYNAWLHTHLWRGRIEALVATSSSIEPSARE
jgi:GT2 family glycosyltransferase